MSKLDNQLVEFIKSALAKGDREFVEDFVTNGPIPGGTDAANRYLLAVALSSVSVDRFAEITGTSMAVAQHLKAWLESGTHS